MIFLNGRLIQKYTKILLTNETFTIYDSPIILEYVESVMLKDKISMAMASCKQCSTRRALSLIPKSYGILSGC